MEVITKQEIINQAIGVKGLDCVKLAQLARFTNEEVAFVKLFWEPAFNKSWIYLTKEMVVDWMGYKDNKNTMSHFYERNLLKNYEKNIDYKEVAQNNELVKNIHSPNLGNEENDEIVSTPKPDLGGGRNKKFYIITGECLKCLLMSAQTPKGKIVRKVYIKTENLVILMIEVIQEQKVLEYKKQLEIKNDEAQLMKDEFRQITNENKWLHLSTKEKVSFTKYVIKRYGLYMGNSQFELLNFILKIGKSIRPIKREIDLSASNAPLNNFKMLSKYSIHDGLEIRTEKYIHALLAPFGTKENNKTSQEHYMIHPKFANFIIEMVLESQNKICSFINQYIDILETNNYDFEIVGDILDTDNILELFEENYSDITEGDETQEFEQHIESKKKEESISNEENKEDIEKEHNETQEYEAEIPYSQEDINKETNGFFRKKMQKRNDFIMRMNNMGFEIISAYDTIEHPVTLLCSEFHEFTIIPNNHDMDRIACYECKRIKKTTDATELLKSRGIICIDYDERKYKCSNGHDFITSNNNYLIHRNGGCPFCNKRAKLTKKDYHSLAAENGGKWIEQENTSSHFSTKWLCAKGHQFDAKYQRAKGYWHTSCKECLKPELNYKERVMNGIKRYPSAELLDTEIASYDARVNFRCLHIPDGWNVGLRGFLVKHSWKCLECKREALETA